MVNQEPENNSDPKSDSQSQAVYIAIIVTVGAFLLLAVFAIRGDVSGMSAAGAIVGAWVGAVVGFYFTKEQVRYASKAGAAAGTDAYLTLSAAMDKLTKQYEAVKARAQELGDQLLDNLPK
jgi:peptidoglycan biosynthesis protein MviN/MurJ (putative lipid II flippase)